MSIDFQHQARIAKMHRLADHAHATITDPQGRIVRGPLTSVDLAALDSDGRHTFAMAAGETRDPSETVWTALIDGLAAYEHARALPDDPFSGLGANS